MTSVQIKDKVLQEIDLFPEDKLSELYNLIHYFRLGLESSQTEKGKLIMSFAGSWRDMPDDLFADLFNEIANRRQHAFKQRRRDEKITD